MIGVVKQVLGSALSVWTQLFSPHQSTIIKVITVEWEQKIARNLI